MNKYLIALIGVAGLLFTQASFAVQGIDAIKVISNPEGGQTYTVTIQILVLMTLLTLLPTLLLTMTSFTRIMIVLGLLRQALGTAQAPSNQVLMGLTLFLTAFIMMPVIEKVNEQAFKPYMEEKIDVFTALERGSGPFRTFMLKQTREEDLELFMRIANHADIATPEEVPFFMLVPAYVTSELKTAFQIGFLIFLPFLVIDLVVASVLMAMGMMMLSPMIISLPFKIMLFVLADGWALVLEMLASSFYV